MQIIARYFYAALLHLKIASNAMSDAISCAMLNVCQLPMKKKCAEFLILAALSLLTSSAAQSAQPRVVIVGAGLAGMTAAYELKIRYGIDSEVYEARDRVGDKTWTSTGPAGPVDLGGAFINTTDAALRSIIKSLDLKEVRLPSRDDAKLILRDDLGKDKILGYDEVFARFKPTLLKIKQDQERLGVKNFKLVHGVTGNAKTFDAMSIHDYLEQIKAPRDFVSFVQAYYGANFGWTLGKLNALHLLTGLSIDLSKSSAEFLDDAVADGALSAEGGNQSVCPAIEERLKNIRKNHVLTGIESPDQKHFTLSFQTPQGMRAVEADYVVLAIPFPILRDRVKIRVSRFPSEILEAIQMDVPGNNSKMILRFRHSVWADHKHSGSLQTEDFMTWANNSGDPSAGNSLTVYFYTEQDFSRTDQLRSQVLALLEKLYPGISGEFVDMRIVDWPHDPFSRGSFSRAKAPDQWAGDWPTVARTHVGHLVFAGAHLAGDLALTGYMNGAASTGLEAAQIIGSSIKGPDGK